MLKNWSVFNALRFLLIQNIYDKAHVNTIQTCSNHVTLKYVFESQSSFTYK